MPNQAKTTISAAISIFSLLSFYSCFMHSVFVSASPSDFVNSPAANNTEPGQYHHQCCYFHFVSPQFSLVVKFITSLSADIYILQLLCQLTKKL
jgi:hypothetical protein